MPAPRRRDSTIVIMPPDPSSHAANSTFSRVGTKLPPRDSGKKVPLTARAREEYYTQIHDSTVAKFHALKDSVEAKFSALNLAIKEGETDRMNQLELEELNQQSFDHLKSEMQNIWNKTTSDVSTLKSFTMRNVDVLNDAFVELKRKVEDDRLTTAKKNQLHTQIESNVMKTVVTSLEDQLNRELSNFKLDVRQSLTDVERTGVQQKSAMQQVEQRLYTHQQQMFEIEKTQAKLSLLYPSDDDLKVAVGGAPGHRLSVIDFSLKGLTDRLNKLEDDLKGRDEKHAKAVEEGIKRMEDRAEEIVGELREEMAGARKESEQMVAEVEQKIGKLIFDFETTSRANGMEMNAEALSVAKKVARKCDESCDYVRNSLDVMETKIGRVRIDFDRMVGDTTAACEALADGLSQCRGEVRNVGEPSESERVTKKRRMQNLCFHERVKGSAPEIAARGGNFLGLSSTSTSTYTFRPCTTTTHSLR